MEQKSCCSLSTALYWTMKKGKQDLLQQKYCVTIMNQSNWIKRLEDKTTDNLYDVTQLFSVQHIYFNLH